MKTTTNAAGVEIAAGDWVCGGHGEDADFGRVFERDGGLWVAWEGGACQTPIGDGEDVEVYSGTWARASAHEDAAARRNVEVL